MTQTRRRCSDAGATTTSRISAGSGAWPSLPGFPRPPTTLARRPRFATPKSALTSATMPIGMRELVPVPPPRHLLTKTTRCDRIRRERQLVTQLVDLLVAGIAAAVRERQFNVRSDAHHHTGERREPHNQRHAGRWVQPVRRTISKVGEPRKVGLPFAVRSLNIKGVRQLFDDTTGIVDHRYEPLRVRACRVCRIGGTLELHGISMPTLPPAGKSRATRFGAYGCGHGRLPSVGETDGR